MSLPPLSWTTVGMVSGTCLALKSMGIKKDPTDGGSLVGTIFQAIRIVVIFT